MWRITRVSDYRNLTMLERNRRNSSYSTGSQRWPREETPAPPPPVPPFPSMGLRGRNGGPGRETGMTARARSAFGMGRPTEQATGALQERSEAV